MTARVAVVGAAGWAGNRRVKAFHELGARVVGLVDPDLRVHALAQVVEAEVLKTPHLTPEVLWTDAWSENIDAIHSTRGARRLALTLHDGPLLRLETYWNPWNHSEGLSRDDGDLRVDHVAHEGRPVWSLHAWGRLGSESVQHFPETDLFLEQAKAALRFAKGEQQVVGYRQALRATELADDILAKDQMWA